MISPARSSALLHRALSGTASTHCAGCAGAGIVQLADLDDVRFVAVLDDPVVAGQAAIDDAVDDIAADFLAGTARPRSCRSSKRGKTLRLGDVTAIAGLAEQLDRGVLQAAAGQAEAERGFGKTVGHDVVMLVLI